MVPLTRLLVPVDANTSANGVNGQKSDVALILIILTEGMQRCHSKYYWHHVMSTKWPIIHLILIILNRQMQWCHS